MRLLLLFLTTVAALQLPFAAHQHSRRASVIRCAADEEPFTTNAGKVAVGSTEYLKGMFESDLEFRSDENLDNLTPSIKFAATGTVIIFGLCAAFVLANPPPP